ncbi:uncharacterized protein KGF55_005615 [Candida pseudojiufengensis]|uniref:uncharacterized protein n=1 Tax=Candida pseudojiufengensis TaxID=497109 RepID=UPI002225A222|nr:uncharacterized protein KGF55_005615 [Candida pseudojiufengensis]KAI5958961.1 hypothetical protein KGF55_005615 [Candida pseudojiufengensis]
MSTEWTKQLENLTISLKYDELENETVKCELTFHNTSKSDVVINPTESNGTKSWLPSFFQTQEEEKLIDQPIDQTLKLVLGHIQLFGYMILNYKFSMDIAALDLNKHYQWWNNTEYLNQYNIKDDEEDKKEQEAFTKIDEMDFIQQRFNDKLVFGGLLAGIKDLSTNEIDIDPTLLHDLINPFDSFPTTNNLLPLSDLTESILPFYTTQQSLLFTDLNIPQNSSKTFKFQIPVNENLPPSYNTRSTGPACDQGWTSIRYSLVVSLHENNINKSKSIYFPLDIRPNQKSGHLQPNYFEKPLGLDKSWSIIEKDPEPSSINGTTSGKKDFLNDLSSLIDSDVYSMPKISTNERRKSSLNIVTDSMNNGSYLQQLPPHLKTSYQLKVNSEDICKIYLSKPYFHKGEDIHYTLEISPGETKIVGVIAYIEANEIYHTNQEVINNYNITGNNKLNTLSLTFSKGTNLINDFINIPKFITSQFQSKSFMDLKYYLNFQFNFSKDDINSESDIQDKYFKSEVVGSTYHFKVPLYIL